LWCHASSGEQKEFLVGFPILRHKALLVGTLLLCTSHGLASGFLRLRSVDLPNYPPVLLSPRIQFDLEFSAIILKDSSLGDIKLVSANSFGKGGEQLFQKSSPLVDSVVAQVTTHLRNWRVDPFQESQAGTANAPTPISIFLQYRIIDPGHDECRDVHYCTSQFGINMTATSISVDISAIGAMVMQ
jgi:hypothetical protein